MPSYTVSHTYSYTLLRCWNLHSVTKAAATNQKWHNTELTNPIHRYE
jgi:hypothetical protein